MNRLLLTGNIILLGIVVIMSGFLLAPSRNSTPPPIPPFKSCYECGNAAFYGMPIDEFMKGIARYRRTHGYPINHEPYMETNKLLDARACWFSLDTLEKYICLIKRFSAQRGLTDGQLGVRFYYGVYSNNPDELWNPNYISHHTLFMVPTYRNKDGNVDFDPMLGTAPLASYFLHDTAATVPQPRVMIFDLGGGQKTQGMAKNQGQLCPPNCPPEDASTLATADRNYPNETYQAN
jgi:hypothetical protein